MYYKNWEELKKISPIKNKKWNKEILYEYLVQSCDTRLKIPLDDFFSKHQNDEELAGLLFEFLLEDEFDGSDSQIGAAYYLGRFEKNVLRNKRDLLLQAQKNPVSWKMPFQDDNLEWL